jgi:hypothetical protein
VGREEKYSPRVVRRRVTSRILQKTQGKERTPGGIMAWHKGGQSAKSECI